MLQMYRRLVGTLLAFALVSCAVGERRLDVAAPSADRSALDASRATVSTAEARPIYPALRLEDLGWLEGRWRGVLDDVDIEEYWTAPSASQMLGLHREIAPSGKVFFEFARIEWTPEGVVYFASPRGGEVTPFRLVQLEPGRVVFSNPAHDFPQRIEYWIDAAGTLNAAVSTERGERRHEWLGWKRSTEPLTETSAR